MAKTNKKKPNLDAPTEQPEQQYITFSVEVQLCDAERKAIKDEPPVKAQVKIPVDDATLKWLQSQKLNTFADVIRLLPPELLEYVKQELSLQLAKQFTVDADDSAADTLSRS